MIFFTVYQHIISNFNDTRSVNEDLISIEWLVIKFVQIKSMESMTTTIKYAPHLVLAEVTFGMKTTAFLDLIFDCLEGILYKCFNFKWCWTHGLLINLSMLNEFKKMRVLDFFTAIQ